MGAKMPFSFIRGYSFHFEDGDVEIEAWFSALSGLEKIHVNGDLVLSRRTFSGNSTNTFNIDGNEYSASLRVIDLLTGPIICTLTKNGLAYKRQRLTFSLLPKRNGKRSFFRGLIVCIVLGALLGVIYGTAKVFWQIPEVFFYISIAMLLLIVVAYECRAILSRVSARHEDEEVD
jgi:hypothetical protein